MGAPGPFCSPLHDPFSACGEAVGHAVFKAALLAPCPDGHHMGKTSGCCLLAGAHLGLACGCLCSPPPSPGSTRGPGVVIPKGRCRQPRQGKRRWAPGVGRAGEPQRAGGRRGARGVQGAAQEGGSGPTTSLPLPEPCPRLSAPPLPSVGPLLACPPLPSLSASPFPILSSPLLSESFSLSSFLSSSWVKNNQLSGKQQLLLSRPPHTWEPLRIAFCGSQLEPLLPLAPSPRAD